MMTNDNSMLRTFASESNLDLPLVGLNASHSSTASYSSYTSGYKDLYGAIPATTTKVATINPFSGVIKVPAGIIADVSGNITGSAASWTNDRTVYGALGTASKTATINGAASGASAAAIGVDGKLSVQNGGTGKDTLTSGYALIGNGTSAVNLRPIVNSASAAAVTTTTNNSLATVNTLYYTLPSINNDHTYNSSSTFFAPITGGLTNHILISSGTATAPVWSENATLNGDTLTLGRAQSAQITGVAGVIQLYSGSTNYTEITDNSWTGSNLTIVGTTNSTNGATG